MKEIKIDVPKGYEIDKEKSTFERIVFKKSNGVLPDKWEDLEEISGYYVNSNSVIGAVPLPITADYNSKNIFTTKEEAKASIAIAQLSQLREVARDGWEPDWGDARDKYCIQKYKDDYGIYLLNSVEYYLSFESMEIAEEFLKKYKDLIEEASPLLFG